MAQRKSVKRPEAAWQEWWIRMSATAVGSVVGAFALALLGYLGFSPSWVVANVIGTGAEFWVAIARIVFLAAGAALLALLIAGLWRDLWAVRKTRNQTRERDLVIRASVILLALIAVPFLIIWADARRQERLESVAVVPVAVFNLQGPGLLQGEIEYGNRGPRDVQILERTIGIALLSKADSAKIQRIENLGKAEPRGMQPLLPPGDGQRLQVNYGSDRLPKEVRDEIWNGAQRIFVHGMIRFETDGVKVRRPFCFSFWGDNTVERTINGVYRES